MNLAALLQFVPLVIGGFLAYHFVIKKELPSKSLGAIITYFVGVLIVLLAVSWFIQSYMPGWADDLLRTGTSSPVWGSLIDTSESIVDEAFEQGPGPQPTIPVVQPVIVTATPPGVILVPEGSGTNNPGTATSYIVVSGDTLIGISQRYGVTVDSIKAANGLTSDLIKVGDTLYIPAP